MDYRILCTLVAVVLLITWWYSPTRVYPSSPCTTFMRVAQHIDSLSAQQVDDLAGDDRGLFCQIPLYMIANPAQCPSDYNWKKAKDKIKCDTSSEAGTLSLDGVTLHL
jgi:hypothetical protein